MVPFQVLFERSPGLLLVLDGEFRIVAVTDAYLAATMTRREALIGRGIFEAFPGYTGGALAHQEVISGQVPFLSKPFTPQSLLRKVNEALRS